LGRIGHLQDVDNFLVKKERGRQAKRGYLGVGKWSPNLVVFGFSMKCEMKQNDTMVGKESYFWFGNEKAARSYCLRIWRSKFIREWSALGSSGAFEV
jgi:hypothetical protein